MPMAIKPLLHTVAIRPRPLINVWRTQNALFAIQAMRRNSALHLLGFAVRLKNIDDHSSTVTS